MSGSGYLRVKNFWGYQNADVWKKAKASKGRLHPPWFKTYVKRDYDLDQLSFVHRLLFKELLGLATVHANAIPNDSEWILKQISMESQAASEALQDLVGMGWLSVSKSRRVSRMPSRKFLDLDVDVDVEKPLAAGPPKQRERDVVWDTLVAELGDVATRNERGKRNSAVKQLKDVGASPEQIRGRCARYREMFSTPLTDQALVSHWSKLTPKPVPAFRCQHCGAAFTSEARLSEHLENVHWEAA